jgi:hypothetical protein
LPKARRWRAKYNSLFAHLKRRCNDINSGSRSRHAAANAVINEVNAALPKVNALYESGEVVPFKDAAPTRRTASAPSAGGALRELSTESACGATELRKAIAAGDEAFLTRLGGRLVFIEGMVLTPPKAAGDMALAEIMAGGGALPVAFPPDTKATTLRLATKVVVRGEAARMGGRWVLKARAWCKASDAKSGRPMTGCAWLRSTR